MADAIPDAAAELNETVTAIADELNVPEVVPLKQLSQTTHTLSRATTSKGVL